MEPVLIFLLLASETFVWVNTAANQAWDRNDPNTGIITSTNYPNNYNNKQDLRIPLQVPVGSTIKITFTDLNIEPESSCRYDWVQVMDSDGSSLTERLCGTKLPSSVTSKTNKIFVVFHSDDSVVKKGFKASWEEVKTEVTLTSGVITSPNYPSNYPDNQDNVKYTVRVPEGFNIELTITDINIEQEKNCGYDSLKIYDGQIQLAKLCGSSVPSLPYTSSSNVMFLYFTSDANVNSKGFRANWRQIVTGSPYVDYIPGDINLLFTVPHDGSDRPDSIPNRVNGCEDSNGQCQFPGSSNCPQGKVCKVGLKSDSNTRHIAETARERIKQLGGGTPHLVISKLHRSKMDPNRDETEAAQGNPEAIQAYRDFHSTIRKVRAKMAGPGLVLDFHGQSHGTNTTELGYLISGRNLNSGSLSGPTSISSLVGRSPYSVADLVPGSAGLGAAIEGEGYRAVPSPRKAGPGKDSYFSGGTITKRYGSRDGGKVDAIQMEMPAELRISGGLEVRTKFAKSLGQAILSFFQEYYIITDSPYVDYIPGDINLLFSVPHDGSDKPDSIPNRVAGCEDSSGQCQFPGSSNCPQDRVCKVGLKSDSNTRYIAETAREKIIQMGGGTPHLVISKLHRSKMDPNREELEAAQGNGKAIQAYRDFHSTLGKVRAQMAGPGLVLDFHGQSHGTNTTELGYLISGKNLNSGSLSGPTSISSLVTRSPYTVADLVPGSAGLGAAMEEEGYRAVPSPKKTGPGKDAYFSGGTITKRYGSRDGGKVDAIQVEMPRELRIDGGLEVRTKFAKSLGEAINKFYKENY